MVEQSSLCFRIKFPSISASLSALPRKTTSANVQGNILQIASGGLNPKSRRYFAKREATLFTHAIPEQKKTVIKVRRTRPAARNALVIAAGAFPFQTDPVARHAYKRSPDEPP